MMAARRKSIFFGGVTTFGGVVDYGHTCCGPHIFYKEDKNSVYVIQEELKEEVGRGQGLDKRKTNKQEYFLVSLSFVFQLYIIDTWQQSVSFPY